MQNTERVHHIADLLRHYVDGAAGQTEEARIIALSVQTILASGVSYRLKSAADVEGVHPDQLARSLVADLFASRDGERPLGCCLRPAVGDEDAVIITKFRGIVINTVRQELFARWSLTDPDGARLHRNLRQILRMDRRFCLIPVEEPEWVSLDDNSDGNPDGQPWSEDELMGLAISCEADGSCLAERLEAILKEVADTPGKQWAVQIDLLFSALRRAGQHWFAQQVKMAECRSSAPDPAMSAAAHEAALKTSRQTLDLLAKWLDHGRIDQLTQTVFTRGIELVVRDLGESFGLNWAHWEYLKNAGFEITAAEYRKSRYRVFDELTLSAKEKFFGFLRE